MFKYLPKNERECKYCHSVLEFEINLSTYMFSGCQNEIWTCPNCKYGLEVLVRYGKVYKKSLFVQCKTDLDED